MSFIDVEKVNLIYPNGKQALFNINFKVEKGEIVALIGPSGAGKSTILNSLNHLNEISKGSININGQDITKLNKQELSQFRKGIGTIFQSYNLVSELDVLTNVLISKIYNRSFFKKLILSFSNEEKKEALDVLERFNILEKAYVRADSLSGGQMQRVSLSRIAYQKPSLVLADEPTSALDPRLTKVVMQDFQKINQEDGTTIIINLHNVSSAISYCDRIIGVKEGRIVVDCKWDEININKLNQIYNEFDELSDEQIQYLKEKRYRFLKSHNSGIKNES